MSRSLFKLILIICLFFSLFLARNSLAVTPVACNTAADCASGEMCLGGYCMNSATGQQQLQAIQAQQNAAAAAAAAISTEDLQQTAAATLNPAGFTEPTEVIARGINVLLAFIGSIALVLYIWAGILWMSSAGTAERIALAKKIMLWTTLGVAVMLGSYVIVTFVFDIFK